MQYTLTFLLRKDNSLTDGLLICRVKWAKCKAMLTFSLGYRVDFDKWDKTQQKVKDKSFTGLYKIPAYKINKRIEEYKNAIEDIFNKINETTEHEIIREKIREELGKLKKAEKGLWGHFDSYINLRSIESNWANGTLQRFYVLKNHLLEFNPDIDFQDFTITGLSDFIKFLTHTKNIQNSTAENMYKKLKQFLKWCLDNDITDIDAITKFKPNFKQPKKPIVFLSWEELMKVWDYIPQDAYEELARDMFLFSCFTGLRVSDVINLSWSDVKADSLEVVTKKTNDRININLNKYSRTVLNRYVDPTLLPEDNKVFPKIQPQTINSLLKSIGKACKIDSKIRVSTNKGGVLKEEYKPKYELLSSHVGRKTFISNALAMGIPPNVVMKWTGHSDYKAMKPYIDIMDETKKTEMDKFNNR